MGFLAPHDLLTNSKIQKYYQNEPRVNDVYSGNSLPEKIKNGAYMINLDKYKDTGTHSVALFCNKKQVIYFDSFGVEHVPEEIKKFIRDKNVISNIFRIQSNNSITCSYFFLGFINYLLAGKRLIDFASHPLWVWKERAYKWMKFCWNLQNKLVRTDKIFNKWNN